MAHKLSSLDWLGKDDKMGFVHRSWLRSQGYPDDYFQGRPVISICNTGVNSHSEVTTDLH